MLRERVAKLLLKFSSPGGKTTTKGPFDRIRLEGEVLRSAPGGPIVARHVDHAWQVDGEPFFRMDCDCLVTVHFERTDGSRSKTYGPHHNISFVDGIAYADHEVFAFADRAIVDWYCHAEGTHWPLLIVESAE